MTTKKAGLSLAEVYRQREEIHRQVISRLRSPASFVGRRERLFHQGVMDSSFQRIVN